jgi:hypothetical protein
MASSGFGWSQSLVATASLGLKPVPYRHHALLQVYNRRLPIGPSVVAGGGVGGAGNEAGRCKWPMTYLS